MSLSFSQQALVASPGAQYSFSSLVSVTPANLPEYVVLVGLDRERYTIASNGIRGTISGNGNTINFNAPPGSDCYAFGVIFTHSAQGYYNSTYGYLSDLALKASTDTYRNEYLSLYGFGVAGTANPALYAKLTRDTTDPYFKGNAFMYVGTGDSDDLAYGTSNFIGTLDVVTRPGYRDSTPNQATPGEIAAVAASFVGQAWNGDGCWVLASNIAAAAGASLPLTVDEAHPDLTPPVPNGEWIVAYNSAAVPLDRQRDWISYLKAGDVVVANNSCGGHIATVVSGFSYSSRLIDNYGSSANDGSAGDVIIRPAHDLLNLVIPADPRNIVIYRLDAPVVTADRPLCVAANATAEISSLFSVSDPGGKPIVSYQLYNANDGGAAGAFVVGGEIKSAHSANAAITVAASSLATLAFSAGPLEGKDTIQVRAFNGSYWGDWQGIGVAIGTSVQAPVLRANSETVVLHGGQSVAISSLVTATSPDSPITSYTILDPGYNGHVEITDAPNVVVSPASSGGTSYEVSAQDFPKLNFVGDANIGGEALTITAHNASALASVPVSIAIGTVAPTAHGISHWVPTGTEIPLASLFNVTQLDSTPIASYVISNATIISWGANVPSSGGTIQLNGAADLWSFPWITGTIQIAAADLDRVTFRAAPDTGAQFLEIRAYDGAYGISGISNVTTVAEITPVTARPASVRAGAPLPLSSLFETNSGAAVPDYYRFADPTGGGSIELDTSATNLQAKSDLTPGVFVIRGSDLGKLTYVGGAVNSTEALSIAVSTDQFHWTAEVSLAVSTTGAKATRSMNGTPGNDTLANTTDNDVINGGTGIDTVTYAGNRSAYSITHNSGGNYTVRQGAGADGNDMLNGIERIQFADKKLAFDTDGSAGNAVKLISAAFGLEQLTPALLGEGLRLFDQGYSLAQVARAVVALPWFDLLPGSSADEAFVNRVYTNVIGSAPTAADLAALTTMLNGDAGRRADLLAIAADSAANLQHVNLVGLANTGLVFV